MLIDIKDYAKQWKEELRSAVQESAHQVPSLAIVQVGSNEASNRYVRNKLRDADEVGIHGFLYSCPEGITQQKLMQVVEDAVERNDAVIVQLPLPPHLDKDRIAKLIPPEKDVDGFRVDSWFKPCTPKGIVRYLRACGFPFSGANVVVIGRSDIVGKPLAQMLVDEDCTVTLCHSKTKDLWPHIENADLVITAVGKAGFLDCGKINVPVIDVGINFDEEGKMCGDCWNTEGKDVTPVPGGVGLLTRCALMDNVICGCC